MPLAHYYISQLCIATVCCKYLFLWDLKSATHCVPWCFAEEIRSHSHCPPWHAEKAARVHQSGGKKLGAFQELKTSRSPMGNALNACMLWLHNRLGSVLLELVASLRAQENHPNMSGLRVGLAIIQMFMEPVLKVHPSFWKGNRWHTEELVISY